MERASVARNLLDDSTGRRGTLSLANRPFEWSSKFLRRTSLVLPDPGSALKPPSRKEGDPVRRGLMLSCTSFKRDCDSNLQLASQ